MGNDREPPAPCRFRGVSPLHLHFGSNSQMSFSVITEILAELFFGSANVVARPLAAINIAEMTSAGSSPLSRSARTLRNHCRQCKMKARCEFAAIPQSLLEIPARDCIVWDRQRQHRISYPPDPRYRRFSGGDNIDLRCIQFGSRAHLVSRWISVRQMGKKEHLAVVVRHLLCRLSWVCAGLCAKRACV